MDNLTPVAEKNQSRPFAISTRLIAVTVTIWIGFGILEHWTGFRAANKFLAIGIFVNLLLSPAIRPQWAVFKYLKERERDPDYVAMDAYLSLMLVGILFGNL